MDLPQTAGCYMGLAIDVAVGEMRAREGEAELAIGRIADFGYTRYSRCKSGIEVVVVPTGTKGLAPDLAAAEHERTRSLLLERRIS